ncbi:MAG: hypothetical protein LC662_06780 [Rhodothermaceae bacterium]|nr:hypothetical protein [Rhodothermaceae bacterium]
MWDKITEYATELQDQSTLFSLYHIAAAFDDGSSKAGKISVYFCSALFFTLALKSYKTFGADS